jgi:hypothetical protein
VHGPKVLDVLAEKYPQAYFGGMVALSKVIRWEVGEAGAFDRSLTPDEIMDRLEKRVGPEGRKLFERFLRQVNNYKRSNSLKRRRGRVTTVVGEAHLALMSRRQCSLYTLTDG